MTNLLNLNEYCTSVCSTEISEGANDYYQWEVFHLKDHQCDVHCVAEGRRSPYFPHQFCVVFSSDQSKLTRFLWLKKNYYAIWNWKFGVYQIWRNRSTQWLTCVRDWYSWGGMMRECERTKDLVMLGRSNTRTYPVHQPNWCTRCTECTWAVGLKIEGRDPSKTWTGGTFCKKNLTVPLNCVNHPSQSRPKFPVVSLPRSYLYQAVPWELGLGNIPIADRA